MKTLLPFIAILFSINSSLYSQSDTVVDYEHILGIEFRTGDNGDLGLVYRRIFPKMNIKVGAYFGFDNFQSTNNVNYLYQTNDSLKPYLLINPNYGNEILNQILEIGVEYKVRQQKYLSSFLCADLVLENRIRKDFGTLLETSNNTISRNGNNYYEFIPGPGGMTPEMSIFTNILESKNSYFGIGGNLRYKLMYEINPYFIVSCDIGINYQYGILYNSSFSYSSEDYKEHFSEVKEKNTSNFNWLTSFGIHYIF